MNIKAAKKTLLVALFFYMYLCKILYRNGIKQGHH
jgi:hypothetical protein